jgi:hypothetical protein
MRKICLRDEHKYMVERLCANAVHRLNREILFLGVHEMKKRALLIGVVKTGSSNLCLAERVLA